MVSRPTKRLVLAALFVGALTCAPAWARTVAQAKQLARTQFDNAEKMREALNGIPPEERTRKDYQRVTDAYRRVYYLAPGSVKADTAVVAVAELLAETGRRFRDERTVRGAIGQYEFLRREYPGSKYRVDALFTIGQIYKEDLNDKAEAKAVFQEFLKRYPRSDLADEARKAIAEIDQPERPQKKSAENGRSQRPENSDPRIERANADDRKPERSSLPLVTGVRHWSTPDYTRVAIDLDAEVSYEAGRIANPDRIFFDLHDTKLASVLVGKTFEVQDGFLRKIRIAQFQRGLTRVVLEVTGVADYSAFLLPNPFRLIIDIHGKNQSEPQTILAKKGAAREQRESEQAAEAEIKPDPTERASAEKSPKEQKKEAEVAKKISDVEQALKREEDPAKAEDKTINLAKASTKELKGTSKPTTEPTFETVAPRETATKKGERTGKRAKVDSREAKSLASGERSLIRALGLKIGRIVVDAGHGGHDTGTIGPNGLQEKDLVLDVAMRLGKLLESKLGADVVYTRDDDTFIPLETRTAIANQQQADLFISIHANSSADPAARGIETYYLNFTSSPDALEVAARENSVSEKSIHELQDLVKKITLKDKIDESREFAADIQSTLHAGLAAKSPAIRNRGVKKAPFIVLIGANMPSILAEISFVSNPTDEKRLQTPDYRQRIAEYLYRGVSKYVSGLSGVKLASSNRASAESAR